MKKIKIIAEGKLKEKYFVDAISEYEKRINRFCKLETIECDNIDEKRIILGEYYLLTDLSAKLVDSEEFADIIKTALEKFSIVNILIGGADGIDKKLASKCHRAISFGRITLPHRLFRVVLFEQLYRAFCIMHNKPYHH